MRSWEMFPGDRVVLHRGRATWQRGSDTVFFKNAPPLQRPVIAHGPIPAERREVEFLFRTTIHGCFVERAAPNETELVEFYLMEDGGLSDRDGRLWSIAKVGSAMAAGGGR